MRVTDVNEELWRQECHQEESMVLWAQTWILMGCGYLISAAAGDFRAEEMLAEISHCY